LVKSLGDIFARTVFDVSEFVLPVARQSLEVLGCSILGVFQRRFTGYDDLVVHGG